MFKRFMCFAPVLMLIVLFVPFLSGMTPRVHADANDAMAQINAVVGQIHSQVAEIRALAQQKKLEAAMQRLEQLNRYISDHLGQTFYDGVQAVRRENPNYSPPPVDLELGPAFTSIYWQNKITTAKQAYQDAVDGLAGLAANRTLATQDEVWAYLVAAKAGFDAVKDVAEDIISLNPFKLAWDFYNACNTAIEQYTAINNAILAGLEIEAMAAQIRTLIRRAQDNLERMKDFNSTLTVYYYEVKQLELHRRNIANYVHRASTDPVFPLDFNNQAYNFDPDPFLTAIRATENDFSAGDFCWAAFQKIYLRIRAEAQNTSERIEQNIANANLPTENKAAYRVTNLANWDYFVTTAEAIYDPHHDQWQALQAQYDQLLSDIDTLAALRSAALGLFWDQNGPASPDLRWFEEEDHGIVQINRPDVTTDPYYLARPYAPWFPTAGGKSLQMPAELPAIAAVGLADYPQVIGDLAAAYHGMALAGLVQASDLTLGSGAPAGFFAVSPLSAGQMDDVAYNLTLLDAQLDDYLTFMAAKAIHVQAAETAQTNLATAQQALVDHIADHWQYLCLDELTVTNAHARQWADLITPVYHLAIGYVGEAAVVRETIEKAQAYMEAQDDFNQTLDEAGDLLADLRGRTTLNTVIRFIVSDYAALPAFPSEQGYLDFIRQIEYLQAFYGRADLQHAMDLRQETIDLFSQIFHSPAADSLPGTLITSVPWFGPQNPFCVLPENVARIQDLLAAVGVWDDRFISTVRDGFPGWVSWARQHLAADWPGGHTDDTPPVAVHITPAADSVGVSLYPLVQVYFSESLDEATIGADTVTLAANGQRRSLHLNYDPGARRLTLDPGGLLPATTYTVDLTDGLTDTAGNALSPVSWSFTTTTAVTANTLTIIEITGVADGQSYPQPVTVGIRVSSGTFSATLSRDGEPAQAILDGHRVTLPGMYRLRVVGSTGIIRTLAFVMGTGTDDFEMDPQTSLVYLDAREDGSSYGADYRVYGQRYFYLRGPAVFMHDMLTGDIRQIFESGYYYNGPGDGDDEYAFLLEVHGDQVLYYKNVGTEGEGVDPVDKQFRLFVYDLDTGTSTEVPTPTGVSITHGCLRYGAVVWVDAHSGVPAVYHWSVGGDSPRQIIAFDGLETWQRLEVLAFDGEWIIYNLDDGDSQTCSDNDPSHNGNDICRPRGDRLAAVHVDSGHRTPLAQGSDEQPLEIASAAVSRGLAAYSVYAGYRDLTAPFGPEMVEIAWLYLHDLFSGLPMLVSRQPEVRRPIQMSESLLYFAERNAAPPYNLDEGLYFHHYEEKLHDLFSHRELVVDFGADNLTRGRSQLFGNRLVSNTDPPRVIQYGLPLSPATVTGRSPAPDAVGVATGTDVRITWSEPMDPATLTEERLALSRVAADGSFIERLAVLTTYDDSLNQLVLTPANLRSNARYRVYVDGTVEDAQGRALVKPDLWYFTTDDVAGPVFTHSTPADGSTRMLTTAAISLHFDEEVDAAGLAAGVLLWRGAAAVPVNVWGGGSDTVTISPAAALAADTVYTVELTPAVTDASGNPMDAGQRFSFRTAASGNAATAGLLAYGTATEVWRRDGAAAAARLIPNLFGVNALRWDVNADTLYYAVKPTMFGFGSSDLKARNMATGATATLAVGLPQVPAFDVAPDGDTVYYVVPRANAAGCQIVADNPTGGSPEVVYEMPQHTITALQVSPDGTRLAMVVFRGYVDPPQIGVLHPASATAVFADGFGHMAWAPDGNRLYAAGTVDGKPAVARFNPDLSGRSTLSQMPGGTLSVSPSGGQLAVLTSTGIALVDTADGTLEDTIVCRPGDMGAKRVVWSADGTALVFGHVTTGGQSQICRFDLPADRVTVLASFTINGMPSTVFDWHVAAADLPPLVPLTITDVSSDGTSRALLDWSEFQAPPDTATYRIYRAGADFSYVTGLAPLATTSSRQYTDAALTEDLPMFYAVTAVGAGGTENPNVRAVGPIHPGDGDVLDNPWELRHWGHLDALPDGDPDGDGLTNRRELEEYTDPLNPDSDGDGALDGAEVAAGFNPLAADVAPLALFDPATRLRAGQALALVADGGSGVYRWTSAQPHLASVDAAGRVQGLATGHVTLSVTDAIFTELPAAEITLTVGAAAVRIDHPEPVHLQPNGYLDLRAAGGSGLYQWQLGFNSPARMEDFGTRCRLEPLATAGTFRVTLGDSLDPDLPADTLDVAITRVAGDLDGNSRVQLDDLLQLLQVQTGLIPSTELRPEGDVNVDGLLDLRDAPYILRAVSESE